MPKLAIIFLNFLDTDGLGSIGGFTLSTVVRLKNEKINIKIKIERNRHPPCSYNREIG